MLMAMAVLKQIWETAREVLGDRAYERYAERAIRQGETPMPPREFYLSQLERKHERPSCCC